jgi:hypothetical protein
MAQEVLTETNTKMSFAFGNLKYTYHKGMWKIHVA